LCEGASDAPGVLEGFEKDLNGDFTTVGSPTAQDPRCCPVDGILAFGNPLDSVLGLRIGDIQKSGQVASSLRLRGDAQDYLLDSDGTFEVYVRAF